MERRIIVWFRNDLRLSDNEALHQACLDAEEIIPIYCFDPQQYKATDWGFPRKGAKAATFLIESVADVQEAFADKAVPFQIHVGATAEVLQAVAEEYDTNLIYCAEEVTKEEQDLETELLALGFRLRKFWQYSLYAKEDLPFRIDQMPEVFTSFRKKMEKQAEVRPAFPEPENINCPDNLSPTSLPSLADLGLEASTDGQRGVLPFKGGSMAAWDRLNQYFWDEDRLKEYKNTRNGMVGQGYSSKFSPWLATGSISAREIYWEVKEYEDERTKNSSTYWLIFELLWRDFFRFTALNEGKRFFRISENPRFKRLPKFEAWRIGETGQDFVDANMKELLYTGFMSNRGRQNVASYLVHDLQLPWYLGAAWFESQLIDYDVCSNYGNWTYVAGIGHDPRPDRYFNVKGQAERYDGDKRFRKLWLEA